MLGNLKSLVPQSIRNLYHLLVAIFSLVRYANPSKDLFIIGVTGTDGKTTTSTMIYHLLNSAGKKVALISTVAAYIGDSELDTGFHVTSPDPGQLQKLLRDIKNQGFKYVVLEATSHGLHQHRLFGIRPQIAVLTNITNEHLDYHKTYRNYVRAKAKLFKKAKVAIINQLDESYLLLKKLIPQSVKIVTYGKKSRLSAAELTAVRSRFPEDFNQLNATAAILAAKQLKIDSKKITKAIKSFPGIPGRMQEIDNELGIKVVVDFAHTPNGLKNALLSLKPSSKGGKLIAVFGSAGLRDHAKRPQMGQIASEHADEAIITAEDPRTEPIWSIITQIRSGITTNHGHVHTIPDRQAAIDFALKIAKNGDIVGIFGKGHEKSMCFGTTEHPWSDQKAALAAISKKKQANK